MSTAEPLRVVCIEDSPIQREILVRLYREDPTLEVVADVGTGREGIAQVKALKPDVVTLDLGLPDTDGFSVVKAIMGEIPTPILIITASVRPRHRQDAFHALTLGAIDVVEKPTLAELRDPVWRKRFLQQLHFVARAPVVSHVLDRIRARADRAREGRDGGEASAFWEASGRAEIVVIAGSAGGPRAVRALLEAMHERMPLPVPVLVGLHLGRDMAPSFAGFLSEALGREVVALTDGGRLDAGGIYVAPGHRRVEMVARHRVAVAEVANDSVLYPYLDELLSSVARAYGAGAVGVILTGMGADGSRGLLDIRRAGGLTLGQDEASCLVYGMPRVAFELGAVMRQRPPEGIARVVLRALPPGQVDD